MELVIKYHQLGHKVGDNHSDKENCTKTSIEYNTVESPTYTGLWGPVNTDGIGNTPPGVISDDSEIHYIETCNVEYECNAQSRSMMCGRSARVSFYSPDRSLRVGPWRFDDLVFVLSAFKSQWFKTEPILTQHRVPAWPVINMIKLVATALILTNVNLERTSVLTTFAIISVCFHIQI